MTHTPTLVPILSAGRHRSPKRGGCFMEIASLLAGERWSDRPRCTHPTLAGLARSVNDMTTDQGRPALAPSIPAVIGTASDDRKLAPLLVALAARSALGALERAQLPRVGIPWPSDAASSDSGELAKERLERAVVGAERRLSVEVSGWRARAANRSYVRGTSSRLVHGAVVTLAIASGTDADRALRELLETAVATCRHSLGMTPAPGIDDERWSQACRLLGGTRFA